ncbi:hypothetical protein BJV82DRAFT_585254 [Fennellomyces sp. T-0311]|nr:hypothetical protein BJV82DRAFT_585254 [Fennellomyces sp. T-0311]
MSAQESQLNTSAIAVGPPNDNSDEPSSSVQRRRKSLQHIPTRRTSTNTQLSSPIENQSYPNRNDADNRRTSFVSSIVDSMTTRRQSSLGFMRLEEESYPPREDAFRYSLRESQMLDTPMGPHYDRNAPNVYPNLSNNDHPMLPERIHSRTPTIASRPPSYKAYSSEERNIQRQQEWAAAIRLQQYYHHERRLRSGSRWLQEILWNREDEQVHWKDAFTACFAEQFQGFHMAFWVVLFVFVGAISVFLPNLTSAAFALWIPLILYVLLAFFMLYHRKKRLRRIQQLEYQVAQARERRIRELMSAVELPENHYFVTEYRRSSHAHPVTTLLPPPPAYQHSTETSNTTVVNESESGRSHEQEEWNRDHEFPFFQD